MECDLEKPDKIRPALGNSSVVICCIGASEKEVFDVTGPYRIDYQATKNLIDAGNNIKHIVKPSTIRLYFSPSYIPIGALIYFWG